MEFNNETKKDWVDRGWQVSAVSPTPFINSKGVYQDCLLPFRRDRDGVLRLLVGHTNLGGVTLWKGNRVDAMELVGEVIYNFKLGPAGEAFNGTRYPSGPLSRGQLWPMGLWIDKNTGIFYCYIHNETGWGAGDTSYTVHGQQTGEPDFRHIGVMSSRDKGTSWDFEGWIISDEAPCWSEKYRPDGIPEGGQKLDDLCLGAGDFSLYANENDGYLYIFYTMHCKSYIDGVLPKRKQGVFAARAPISSNGLPGSWMKYYDGAFLEPGLLGKAAPVFEAGFIPSVTYNSYLGKYLMTSYDGMLWQNGKGAVILAMSDDLVNWKEWAPLASSRADISNPYFTMVNASEGEDISTTGRTFRVFMESNGTDVQKFDVTIK